MRILIEFLLLSTTTIYHYFVSKSEKRKYQPPGQLFDIGGYKLHLHSQGKGNCTVIIESSLGGLDGYFLIEEIAKLTQVCIYDRGGYGWSEFSPKSRCSQEIVQELDTLLTQANIEPPYILVGDSFGSYNVRLYAHQFPEKVRGIILTDGLHEEEMLKMSPLLQGLKLFFMSGFFMSIFGAILGIIRICGNLSIFELIKKELRQIDSPILETVKRHFYQPKHWLTMLREMWNLDVSSRQVRQANNLGNIPVINIKAKTFLKPSLGTFFLPIKSADKLRDKMHNELLKLSTNCTQIQASNSSHFVWIDEPEIIIAAIVTLNNVSC